MILNISSSSRVTTLLAGFFGLTIKSETGLRKYHPASIGSLPGSHRATCAEFDRSFGKLDWIRQRHLGP